MKTIVNKTVLAVSIGLLFPLLTTCTLLEPYENIYYHKIGAEGYVYYQDKPIPDARIGIDCHFKSNGLFTKQPIYESFKTDATGYFCAKFIRRTKHEDVNYYYISIGNDTLHLDYRDRDFSITPADLLKSKTNIQLGRINLTKRKI